MICLKIPGAVGAFIIRINDLTEKFLRRTFYLYRRVPLQIQVDSGKFVNILNSKHVLKDIVENQVVSLSPACVRRTGTRIDMATVIKVPGPSALSIDVWRMHGASALHLTRAALSNMSLITNRGVKILLSRAPNLKDLTLMSLPGITDDLWPDLKVAEGKRQKKKIYLASGKIAGTEYYDKIPDPGLYCGRLLSIDEQIDCMLRKKLERLELVDLRGITQRTAKLLAYKPIDKIQTLVLHNLPNWPLGASSLLCSACGNLKEVDFCRINMSDKNLHKILETNQNLNSINLHDILEQRPFVTGSNVCKMISNSHVTHFITDSDVLRRAVEKSCPNIVTNFIGSTGKNKKECIQIPLSPLPSRTWNLIGGEDEMFSKIKNEDLAALEDALSDKIAVSTQVAVKRDLRLLKRKAEEEEWVDLWFLPLV